MAYQPYKLIHFSDEKWQLILLMNTIIEDYQSQGFVLTVRQLYYQLVARDAIPNTENSYKRITGIVNDARIAGVMDWDAIEDRTREFVVNPHWDSAAEILESAANSFAMDMWTDQDYRVFVIVEKEALVGILQGVCSEHDVPLLAARGYPSGTVLRDFAKRMLIPAYEQQQETIILHLGDHDPSGIDMSRDLEERLTMFTPDDDCDRLLDFRRIALSMDQIEELKPPPNPAKSTDARFKEYRKQFGSKSWELDAIPPQSLVELVRTHIEQFISPSRWNRRKAQINDTKDSIREFAKGFEE
jgi:DNA topoisomerase VI subunit A